MTYETAEEIRRRHAAGEDQGALAEEYGVKRHTVNRVVHRVLHAGATTAAAIITDRPDWWDRRGCKGVDTAVFYPTTDAQEAAAKKVCASCPVRDGCLDYSLQHREDHGVWGGATERERRKMGRPMKRRAAATHGTRACYQAGCRKPECTAAETQYKAQRRRMGA